MDDHTLTNAGTPTLTATAGGQGTFSAVGDNGNGTYSAVFTGTLAGSNTIQAWIEGKPVSSPVPSITVQIGAYDPAHSLVAVSAKSMQAGGSVTLQPEDAGGNRLLLGSRPAPIFTLASGSCAFGNVISIARPEPFRHRSPPIPRAVTPSSLHTTADRRPPIFPSSSVLLHSA